MSIGTVLTSIGTFLSGPIMTGMANVATFANLGVGIATKVDTKEIKTATSGIRSDIATLDKDILSLAGDISDMRQERYWSLALGGETPVSVTGGGNPTLVQLAGITPTQQPQPVQQVVQPVQQPAPQPQVVQQYITRDELNNAFNNLVGSIPTIVGQAVQQVLVPHAVTVVNPAPAAVPETKPDEKVEEKSKTN